MNIFSRNCFVLRTAQRKGAGTQGAVEVLRVEEGCTALCLVGAGYYFTLSGRLLFYAGVISGKC